MPTVSVTRARIRRWWSFPSFALAAIAALRQARAAPGFLGGSVCPDRRLTFWTMTSWESEAAMHAYMRAGAHGAAMPRFAGWCDEASVTHWEQAEAALPSWPAAAERMRAQGRPSKVRRPSGDHQAMTFAAPNFAAAAAIAPVR